MILHVFLNQKHQINKIKNESSLIKTDIFNLIFSYFIIFSLTLNLNHDNINFS